MEGVQQGVMSELWCPHTPGARTNFARPVPAAGKAKMAPPTRSSTIVCSSCSFAACLLHHGRHRRCLPRHFWRYRAQDHWHGQQGKCLPCLQRHVGRCSKSSQLWVGRRPLEAPRGASIHGTGVISIVSSSSLVQTKSSKQVVKASVEFYGPVSSGKERLTARGQGQAGGQAGKHWPLARAS